MSLERLQKIIARSGIWSRREAEDLMRRGKVCVNGKKATLPGTKADSSLSRITVNGKPLWTPRHFDYLLFNKPRKCVVTRSDPEGRKTVYDFLPKKFHHLKPVGRLDYDSQGLLILTNDGALAQKLTHPRFDLEKIYEVKVSPKPGGRQIQRLERGVMIDGLRTRPSVVEVIRENPGSTWLKMTLHEGRNRQIRRMCEKVNLTVKTLVRTEIGPFKLKGLMPGKWKSITIG